MNTKKFWKVGSSSLTILLLAFLAFITSPNNLTAQPPAPPTIEEPAASNWTVTITVNSSNVLLENVEASFGIASGATGGYDADLDVKTQLPPPSLGRPYLNVAFQGPGLLTFSTDIRDAGPWSLIVQSGDDFTLSWDSSSLPADYPLKIDGTDMRTQNSKDFSAGSYILTIEKAINIAVSPSTGGLGTEITVEGTNFGANESVKIDFGTATEIAQATTDADGSFTATFSAVPQPAGNVTITATGVTSGQSATDSSFVYSGPSITSVEVAGSPVTVGGKITVKVKGETGCTAKFSIAGITTEDVEMTESADTPGTYVAEYTVSEGEEGVYDVTATLTDTAGNEVSKTAEKILEVTSGTKFTVTLNPGPNLLHIPVADAQLGHISDLYKFLIDQGVDLQMLIYYNTDVEAFRSYGSWSTEGSAEDIALEPYTGLIAILKSTAEPKSVTFEGGMYEETNVPLVAGQKGINLVGLPVNDPDISTLDDLATAIGSDNLKTIIAEKDGKFVSHIEAGDLAVTGSDAFIIIVKNDTTLKLEGGPWANEGAPATPSISIAERDLSRADVMVVQGATVLEKTHEPLSGLNVTVQNMSTNLSQTDVSGRISKDGKYSVVFVNLSGNSIAKVGDLLRISVEDPSGKFGAESIQHRVTEEDINKGIIVKDLLLTKIPEHSALLQNYPNPFNPETWIPFQLAKPADVTLKIYNLSGRVIRKINIGYKPAGTYTSSRKAIYWDGRNDFGEKVASGIYFYAINAGSFNAARKMIIVK